ncbi:MAG: signal peptidase I [Actinobacteria bacterium]|nr:signal peptidase I [Actinomycetota bacterium]
MEPTLHCARPSAGCRAEESDEIRVREVRPIERGDIVVFESPKITEEHCGSGGKYVIRVIGLPGETVRLRDASVFVDGAPLREPYLKPGPLPPDGSWGPVPTGHLFILGDNRPNACDSRVWGMLPRARVVGTVTEVIRP